MGHSIRALIGKLEVVKQFSDSWIQSTKEELEQGFGLVKINDEVHNDVNELANNQASDPYEEFEYLSASLHELFVAESFKTQLAYFETDYFGGCGSQVIALYEDGKITVGPLATEDIWDEKANKYVQKPEGKRAINQVLNKMGAWCKKDGDEFDSLGLTHHRSM